MRLVFHHIPKTGGSSLVAAMRTVLGDEEISYNSGDTKFLTTHQPYELNDFPTRQHLTILRDPVDRLVSWIRYRRTTVSKLGELARILPASEFLALDEVPIHHCARDRQVRQLGGNFHTDPIPMQEALERSLERLSNMFWVGQTETLDADLERLFSMLRLENPLPDRWNVAQGPKDIDDYDLLERLNVWDRKLVEAWHDRSG